MLLQALVETIGSPSLPPIRSWKLRCTVGRTQRSVSNTTNTTLSTTIPFPFPSQLLRVLFHISEKDESKSQHAVESEDMRRTKRNMFRTTTLTRGPKYSHVKKTAEELIIRKTAREKIKDSFYQQNIRHLIWRKTGKSAFEVL
jgi:hypothetical protein